MCCSHPHCAAQLALTVSQGRNINTLTTFKILWYCLLLFTFAVTYTAWQMSYLDISLLYCIIPHTLVPSAALIPGHIISYVPPLWWRKLTCWYSEVSGRVRRNKGTTYMAYCLAKLVLKDLTLPSYVKKVTELVKERIPVAGSNSVKTFLVQLLLAQDSETILYICRMRETSPSSLHH